MTVDLDDLEWADLLPPEPAVPVVPTPRKRRRGQTTSTPPDPEAQKRGRNNRKRGNRIQRQKITGLGGRNLAGNNPNLDGLGILFRYESKSARPGRPTTKPRVGTFPEGLWSLLKSIPAQAHQTRVLIVTEAPGRGHKSRSFVVVDYDDWRGLHQEDASLDAPVTLDKPGSIA